MNHRHYFKDHVLYYKRKQLKLYKAFLSCLRLENQIMFKSKRMAMRINSFSATLLISIPWWDWRVYAVILTIFIFCGMFQNDITKFQCFSLGSERNSEFFSLSQNGSERYSERFLFRETNGIPTEWIKTSVCSVSCEIILLSENFWAKASLSAIFWKKSQTLHSRGLSQSKREQKKILKDSNLCSRFTC